MEVDTGGIMDFNDLVLQQKFHWSFDFKYLQVSTQTGHTLDAVFLDERSFESFLKILWRYYYFSEKRVR